MLEDGTYDALVLDADEVDGVLHVDLTILAGHHKGEVLSLTAPSSGGRDPIELLGIPATLTVAEGRPSVRFEP